MNVSCCPPLDYLDRMTDSAGMLQHAAYNVPQRASGYATRDNAQALRLCARLCLKHADQRMMERVARYLSFIEHAQRPTGGFHNSMSYQRVWIDNPDRGDSQGQAILALAEVRAGNVPKGFRDLAKDLMENAIPELQRLTSLRTHAYVIQAWCVLRRANVPGGDDLESIARSAVDRLVEAWKSSHSLGWQWFEPQMSHANAVLPHAMFDAAEMCCSEDYLSIAETSFQCLNNATTSGEVFWPIGNHGYYTRNGQKSLYDQQPVEASTMAAASLAAFRLRQHQNYLVAFQKAHGWFHGENSLHFAMAEPDTGACYDGLEPTGINRNQNAESTLAYLWTEVLAQETHSDNNDTISFMNQEIEQQDAQAWEGHNFVAPKSLMKENL